MNTFIKTTVNKSAPVRVPSDSPLVVALQYLMSVVLVLALAGLGVWLQHVLGSHSQGHSEQELTSQGAAVQLKVDDDGYQGYERLPVPDSFDIDTLEVQRGWLIEKQPSQL